MRVILLREMALKRTSMMVGLFLVAVGLAGCEGEAWQLPTKGGDLAVVEKVPSPVDLLLPRSLRVHPFTQTGSFEQGDSGVHARVQALDSYGQALPLLRDTGATIGEAIVLNNMGTIFNDLGDVQQALDLGDV